MAVQNFSLLHWVDLHDLSSSFVSSQIVIQKPNKPAIVESEFGYRSKGSVPIAIVPGKTGDAEIGYCLGVSVEVAGNTFPAGQSIGVHTRSYVITTSGYLHRISWIKADDVFLGAFLSPSWDIVNGHYVSGDVEFQNPKGFMVSVNESDLAGCPNIEVFLEKWDEKAGSAEVDTATFEA